MGIFPHVQDKHPNPDDFLGENCVICLKTRIEQAEKCSEAVANCLDNLEDLVRFTIKTLDLPPTRPDCYHPFSKGFCRVCPKCITAFKINLANFIEKRGSRTDG